jgi:hypothetical protein
MANPNDERPAGATQPAFSARGLVRLVLSLIACVPVAACGSGTPTSPTPPPAIVRLGPQILEIFHKPSSPLCGIPAGVDATLIVTRVTVAWSGSDWVATPTTSASGDIQMHFRPSGTASAASLAVTGTITGTAIHLPDYLQGFAAYSAQVSFAAGSPATLTGTATSAGTKYPYAEVDGTGTGTVTLTDGAGLVCPGTSFSWMMVSETAS